MSHIAGISDAARARELYKYYRPENAPITASTRAPPSDADPSNDLHVRSDVSSSKICSPDTALTAFCQLVSWRTGMQRAMISFIDEDTQYFVAESTKTLDLLNNDKYGPDDGLWIGCGKVSKAGRLCERTISLPPAPAGKYPAFIISDLSKDGRFNQLPFVMGPPFLKFYAGTPLITKRGIPIGSLFVVDSRVRAGLRKEEIHFMGTMASTIMEYMGMLRKVEEHRRGVKMSRGLASFVEGHAELNRQDVIVGGEGRTSQFEIRSATSKTESDPIQNLRVDPQSGSISSIERKEDEYSKAILKTEAEIMALSQKSDAIEHVDQPCQISDSYPAAEGVGSASIASSQAELTPQSAAYLNPDQEPEAAALKLLFSRAANLIREAFEVDGGSVFYDAQKGFGGGYSPESAGESSTNVEDFNSDESMSSSDSAQVEGRGLAKARRAASFSPTSRSGIYHRNSMSSERIVEILGFSTPTASSVQGDDCPGSQSFMQFDERSLHGFLRRYPRGKLWTFEHGGNISSSEDDITTSKKLREKDVEQSKRKRSRTAVETAILQKHFPGVRQLLFVPLWDASRSRWLSGNFTWSTELTRVLSKQSELAFLIAFGNSVMVECSRIGTEIADQKKGDFIGSISHELRSPLHGILASAEFLSDEITGPFTKGLVETIDSCGRTLLDTINHILDFSKINHLEKNWRRSRRADYSISRPKTRGVNSLALHKVDLPMVNLFADVDISILCEEVIEGVFAGHHFFQNVKAPSFDVVTDAQGNMSDTQRPNSASSPILDTENPSQHSNVAVILDVDVKNYHFTTQPGAFRRIIMNLLGNALKYTSHGYVKIKLETTEMDDFKPPGSTESIPRACVTLTITDTGRGISSDFIRSKLFTPFAQENTLSRGTGLGLSMVRSIVSLLEGEIAIKSQLGHGTEVRVTLPLLRELPKREDSSGSTPKSISSVPKESEKIIDQLRPRVNGKTVLLCGFDDDPKDSAAFKTNQLLKSSVRNFLVNWYGLTLVFVRDRADIIVVNEPSPTRITELASLRRSDRRLSMVLALCSHTSRFDPVYANMVMNVDIGFLPKPIGPLKLARAIIQCLDGIPVTNIPGLERSPTATGGLTPGATDLSNIFEDLSLSANEGEILDNSRMAADSDNARKAIESPKPMPGIEGLQEFPFLNEPEGTPAAIVKSMLAEKEILQSIGLESKSGTSAIPSRMENDVATIVSNHPTPPARASSTLPAPRLLLVDDNKINLRLLRTYMRKRQYPIVDEAENGLEAVNAMANCREGYDIIFMDISMPVLDGFGATRQIRQIEQTRMDKAARDGTPIPSPALIIALTGLASSRDQSNAFTSGVDLFLTKPVTFKEVGIMLDNWEANREREARPAGETSGDMR